MLRRVVVKNFKSLDVDVEFDPVTVLVGRSGTGKTNLVEALRFLREFLTNRQNPQPTHISAINSKEGQLHLTVWFDLADGPGQYCYMIEFSYKEGGKVGLHQEKLSLNDEVLFCQQGGKWVVAPNVTTPPRPSGVMLPLLEGLQNVSIAHVVLTKGLGCYDFPGTICVPASKGKEGGLSDRGSNYGDTFQAITTDLKRLSAWNEINSALRCLNPSFVSIDAKKDGPSRLVVSHRFNENTLVFGLHQESEGFRRFLAHMLALYQSPPKETLVFEEPEKGIHPGALDTLAEELRVCPDSGRGQVILTTHSPTLLDSFAPESIRVVEINNGITSITPVDSSQLEALKERLLTPGELLTVEPARGMAIKGTE